MSSTDFTPQLRILMGKAGISSFKDLGRTAAISERQILRLRRGCVSGMKLNVLQNLSATLGVSFNQLVEIFSDPLNQMDTKQLDSDLIRQQLVQIQQEYERSLVKLEQQREVLEKEFQQNTLQIIESLLLFFPTAAQKVRANPQLEAIKILPLVEKPLEKLLSTWGIQAIASVGAEVPYDPQYHELLQGTAGIGEAVKVVYIGYRQEEKLLYRAKVSK
ncbi:nucleotide exchange factor GrpE [Cylindrospermopsis curvispora GIHE-G1]|uniref:Nucleotide exchange factor GrpE n=2 Tax=Cylindrospermopsis TaxID=77021 RepID=A0A7H0F5H1_9CYAN|nr:nucleotide exchange factor GrpE [Cylindrospermopsis curvispora GIHE-G1]